MNHTAFPTQRTVHPQYFVHGRFRADVGSFEDGQVEVDMQEVDFSTNG